MDSIMGQSFRLPSGYAMPVLGLGTWQLVGSRCERIVSKAIELGYRHFDTAELYGNESEIGRAIAHVGRASLFLTSKVSSENLRTNDVIRACARSLERLGTSYLDLYLIHWPNDEIPIAETMWPIYWNWRARAAFACAVIATRPRRSVTWIRPSRL